MPKKQELHSTLTTGFTTPGRPKTGRKTHAMRSIMHTKLYWLNQPILKSTRQIGSLPEVWVNNKKIFEATTQYTVSTHMKPWLNINHLLKYGRAHDSPNQL